MANKHGRAITTGTVGFRPGDGFPVEATVSFSAEANGLVAKTIGYNVQNAPAPDRRYVADIYDVHPAPGGYRFLFAQQKLGHSALRSLVMIYLTAESTAQFVESIVNIGTPTIPELLALTNAPVEGPTTISAEPDQTVSLTANIIITAMSNAEAAMDFLQISTFSAHALNRGAKQLQVNAVVRVEMRTGQLQGLVEALKNRGVVPKVL